MGPQVFTGGGTGENNRYNPQGSATLTLLIGYKAAYKAGTFQVNGLLLTGVNTC